MPYRILSVIPDTTACAYYRHILPYVHLKDRLADRGIELETSVAFSGTKEYDAYLFSRTYDPRVFPTIVRLYEQGAKIVWDLDDDLPSIPDWSPAKAAFPPHEIGFLAMCLRMSSLVSCSTARLARSTEEYFGGCAAGKTRVAENLIDPRAYEPHAACGRQEDGGPLRILFAGSASHCGDMSPAIELVDRILADESDTIILFMGYCPPQYARVHPARMIRIRSVDKTSYEPLLSMIGPHIGLAPLDDCHFNHCKSAIKWMEYSCAGAATLASKVPPFSDVIENCSTGLLATTPEGWIEAYKHTRKGWCRLLASKARDAVHAEFSWLSDSARRRAWLDFFLSIPDAPAV